LLRKKPSKIFILLSAINKVKNWYVILLVHFGIYNKKFFILKLKNGFKLKLRTKSTDVYAFTHVWLLQEYYRYGFEIKDNDVIIDVGAHIGLFALFSSQFCKNGRIYCFEPVKENFDLLKSNLELNDIENVIVANMAVSSSTGTVTIYLNEDEAGHSMHVPSQKQIQVESFSLQDIFDSYKLEKCDFLKIDCEGEEYEIINSLPTSYFDKIKKMCIEYHFVDTKPHLLENMIKKLKMLSYTIDTRKILPSIGFLYAKKG